LQTYFITRKKWNRSIQKVLCHHSRHFLYPYI